MNSILTHPLFWNILEESGSINESRGMKRLDFNSGDSHLATFSKTHSYGEYIFDWAWADAFSRYGVPYYPKLTSMVPFTPATAEHFRGPQKGWPKLLELHDELLKNHSSAHFLFTTEEENIFLKEHHYLLRDSFQYHFFNEDYKDFDEFLSRLKSKKAKNIRTERSHPKIQIERLTGDKLSKNHALEMYNFYLMTLDNKKAIPYLTKEFYSLLFQKLSHNVLYVRANSEEKLIAGALFFYDEEKMYGRYWGTNTFIPNLHFELCYYQGIEFCIEKGLQVFEAGAQGEHKIARGFRPVLTRSAHKINHPDFSQAIAGFIKEEKMQINEDIKILNSYLPFKN